MRAAAAGRAPTEALVAEDDAEAELLVEARRLVGPAHEALGAELVDDVCVPRARLADLLTGVGAHRREQHDVLVTCAGHAGDGNMHPSVVFDPLDGAMAAAAHRRPSARSCGWAWTSAGPSPASTASDC